MKLRLRRCRRLAAGAVLAAAAALFPSALGAQVTASTASTAAAVSSCHAASTAIWASLEGAGTAGTTYYELEFSNIGRQTCTLEGYPEVFAVGKNGVQIGEPASRRGVPATVTLAAGATAHVVLGVVDTGALCGRQGVMSAGLRVVPPGQRLPQPAGEDDEVTPFPLQVCPRQSSMNVLPIHSGVGVPNYSFS